MDDTLRGFYWLRNLAKKVLYAKKGDSFHKGSTKVNASGADATFANVEGLEVCYKRFGNTEDPTVLFLHGYGTSLESWDYIAPNVAERGFDVICLDLIGHGRSSKPFDEDYTIAFQSKIVEGFVEKIGLKKVTIGGNSYGGAVALDLTLKKPEMIDKLVLVDAVSNNYVKQLFDFRIITKPFIGEFLTPTISNSSLFLAARMKKIYHRKNKHLINLNRIKKIQRLMGSKDANHALLMTLRQWNAEQLEENASQILNETLVIWGEHDSIIPIENGKKLSRLIPNSSMVIFEDCGHAPQEELPADFTKAFCDFYFHKI